VSLTYTRQQTAAVIAATTTLAVTFGTRATFGLFLAPLAAHGVPIGQTALAIALHNITWGLVQPFAGAWADRKGTVRIQAIGAVLFAAGFALPAFFTSGWAVMLGIGVLTGVGVALTGFSVSMAGASRCFHPQQRSTAMGICNVGGSAGQLIALPLIALLVAVGGPSLALLAIGGVALIAIPLGWPVDRAVLEPPTPRKSIAAVRGALGDRAFVLLTLGFFTCGLQLAFLSTHLPGYLSLCGMPAAAGAWALTVVAAANVVGTYLCGRAGARLPPQLVLAGLYALRGVAILLFWAAPKNNFTLVLFAVVMGLTWLGTIPLTNGVIARLYGVGDLGALFGICFLSHQIGSFVGAWVGGLVFEFSGTYDIAFIATGVFGFVAAAFNLPIRMPRVAVA
jgi:MFS family permease